MRRTYTAILLTLLFSAAWAYAYEDQETDLPMASIQEVSSFAAEGKLAESQDRIITQSIFGSHP